MMIIATAIAIIGNSTKQTNLLGDSEVMREYLKARGDTQTFYNVEEILNATALKTQTGKTEVCKDVANAVASAVFSETPLAHKVGETHVFISDRSWYVEADGEHRIASIVTLSLDELIGKQSFEAELEKSKLIREKNLQHLNEVILPFLMHLVSPESGVAPLIAGYVLRGDILNPNRYPNPDSDIDVIILTNFDSHDLDKKESLLKRLCEVPNNGEICYYQIGSKGYTAKGMPLVRKNTTSYKVEFSVISLPGFADLCKTMKKINKKFDRYYAENFPHAVVLYQKGSNATRFLDDLVALSPRI